MMSKGPLTNHPIGFPHARADQAREKTEGAARRHRRARTLLALAALTVVAACDTGGPSTRLRGMRDTGTSTPGVDVGTVVGGCDPMEDADGDGIADSREGSNDPDGDGVPSFEDDDSDGDGLSDAVESGGRTPCAPQNSDSDALPDALDTDSDNDGVLDADEVRGGTDPTNVDTDGDGVSDLAEGAAGTSPTDPSSTIPDTDFFVVLPYNGDRVMRPLRFGTNITQADVFFLMDTTGSMSEEVGNVQAAMEAVIIPGVQDLIPDVQFGAGGFDDFPIGTHGGLFDLPYYHLIDVVPYEQDLGALGGAFLPPSDVRTFNASGANGTRDILDAVRGYPRHAGNNGCESGLEGLYQAATGMGVSWGGSAVPPKTCVSPPDERGTRRGYPCFRPDSLPIIVLVSDAPFKPPTPSSLMPNTLEGDGCRVTDEVPAAATYDSAVTALRSIGARVVSLSTDSIPSNPGYPSTNHLCNMAADTGAVRADGSPLCFELGTSGRGIDSRVVNAIGELVGGTPQDVSTRTENVMGNPDEFDATLFIKAITPVEGYRDGIAGPNPGVSYTRRDETTFYGVIPGTMVDFDVDFWNDVRPPAATAQVFQARIVVVGNGVARLDERRVFIVVPPDGGEIII
jgi:hypothetical protein